MAEKRKEKPPECIWGDKKVDSIITCNNHTGTNMKTNIKLIELIKPILGVISMIFRSIELN